MRSFDGCSGLRSKHVRVNDDTLSVFRGGILASATRNILEERKNLQGRQKMGFLHLKGKEQHKT